MLVPDLNRDKAPKEEKKNADKMPHSNTYKTNLIDDCKILSTRSKSFAVKFGDREIMRNKKMHRFIDKLEKQKQWVPGPSKYHTPVDKIDKIISKGPRSTGFRFKGR